MQTVQEACDLPDLPYRYRMQHGHNSASEGRGNSHFTNCQLLPTQMKLPQHHTPAWQHDGCLYLGASVSVPGVQTAADCNQRCVGLLCLSCSVQEVVDQEWVSQIKASYVPVQVCAGPCCRHMEAAQWALAQLSRTDGRLQCGCLHDVKACQLVWHAPSDCLACAAATPQVADGLYIIPDWSEPTDPSATNIILTPGVAFGTGGSLRACV